jgi:hypothetical protein
MYALWIASVVTFGIFALAFYQNYRDQQRWKRIASGMSLFGDRQNIPPLVLNGVPFEPHERNVLVVWGNRKKSAFYTVSDAKKSIEKERAAGKERASDVRVFAWNGETWTQRI